MNRKNGNKRTIGMELTKMPHFSMCITINEFRTSQNLFLRKVLIQKKSDTKLKKNARNTQKERN